MASENKELLLPSEKVLKHVSKLSIEQDKPIMMDYWTDSMEIHKCINWC